MAEKFIFCFAEVFISIQNIPAMKTEQLFCTIFWFQSKTKAYSSRLMAGAMKTMLSKPDSIHIVCLK
jgi:hypothetical protein